MPRPRPLAAAPAALAALIALAVPACVSAPSTDPAELPAGQWTLDPAHARVNWKVRHMGLAWYVARFDAAQASLDFDPARPEDAELTAVVEAASVSTGDPDFDATLRGGGWLDAEAHPEIVFRSIGVEVTGETTGRVSGELTLKGVTRPVVMETVFYGGVFNPLEGRRAVGFRGEFAVDRTEFGVGRLPGNFIGDEVRLTIEAEFLREGEPDD